MTSQEECRKKFNEDLKRQFGLEPCKLQAKWRNMPEPIKELPKEFPWEEIEAALLDAFINEGSATAWRGDGSSCAVQIVHNMWILAQSEIKKRDQKIELLKEIIRD